MIQPIKHPSVCICTYKRPEMLDRLLRKLAEQDTGEGLFTFSVVICDNDRARSAEPIVEKFMAEFPLAVKYCVQSEQNISLTRNKAVADADGDCVVFIDDDEFPVKHWLLNLVKTANAYDVDGVLGPVKRHFDEVPPTWILKSNLYERMTHPTGTVMPWRECRTGNVLLKKHLFEDGVPPFRPEFRGGEDTDFFQRMSAKGHVFNWCDEAIAYEVIPPSRWKPMFMLKRALLRGAVTLRNPGFGARDVVKSMVAVPVYVLALPFALVSGRHKSIPLMIRLCDHLGKLLAVLGIDPIKVPYITG